MATTLSVDRPLTPDSSTITVEPSPAGIARGIEALAAAHRTSRPARSHPTARASPPALALGDETSIPPAVQRARPASDLTITVPPSLRYLFVVAPLAYYLGADIELSSSTEPAITAAEAKVDCSLGTLPEFQTDVADLLERVFVLDCLLRDAEGAQTPTAGACALAEHLPGLAADAADLRSAGIADRLARYLRVPESALAACQPEWHLSTYVAPESTNVACLPRLLDSMSLVFLPEASRYEEPDLLDRSLSAAYERGHADHPTRLEPPERRGQVQAWLAPGAPVGPFKATRSGLHNAEAHGTEDTAATRVRIVLNDREMGDEAETAASTFCDRLAQPISCTIERDLTRAELAARFREPAELVHFVGHCDAEGLRCPDGWLDAGSLETVGTRAFVLNACGSYQQGLSLLSAGAVAGAVTLRNVLDDQAATVGRTLVRLLARGFPVARAVALARRRVLMGVDYAAVGDGTDVPFPDRYPVVYHLDRSDDRYRLRAKAIEPGRTGHRFTPPFEAGSALNGNAVSRRLGAEATQDVLSRASLPVIFEDRFYWSDALASDLPGARRDAT